MVSLACVKSESEPTDWVPSSNSLCVESRLGNANAFVVDEVSKKEASEGCLRENSSRLPLDIKEGTENESMPSGQLEPSSECITSLITSLRPSAPVTVLVMVLEQER